MVLAVLAKHQPLRADYQGRGVAVHDWSGNGQIPLQAPCVCSVLALRRSAILVIAPKRPHSHPLQRNQSMPLPPRRPSRAANEHTPCRLIRASQRGMVVSTAEARRSRSLPAKAADNELSQTHRLCGRRDSLAVA
jgi:hypothetical protein